MRKTLKNTGESGSAMVSAFIVMTMLMLMGMGFVQLGLNTSREARNGEDERGALYLAEAGIAEAIASLAAGGDGNIGSDDARMALANGELWVEAEDLGDGTMRLVSEAAIGRGRAALEVVVVDEESGVSIFPGVFVSDGSIPAAADTFTDSYDSTDGSYASQAVNDYRGIAYARSNGDVFSNDSIKLSSRATFFGDAGPGPSGAVSQVPSSHVSGSTLPQSEEFSFPEIPWPSGVDFAVQPVLSLGRGDSKTLSAGRHLLSEIELGRGSTLTIEGPAEVYMSDFDGGADASMVVDASGGEVTLYIDGDFGYDKRFEVTATGGSPLNLAWMLVGERNVTFTSGAQVIGGFYGPETSFRFTAGCEVWGAISGEAIGMSAGVRFHYDEALGSRELDETDTGESWRVVSWAETGLKANRESGDDSSFSGRVEVGAGSDGRTEGSWQVND